MVKMKDRLTNVRSFLFKKTKRIRVKAKPPFLHLKPALGIYWNRHRPLIKPNNLNILKMQTKAIKQKNQPINLYIT